MYVNKRKTDDKNLQNKIPLKMYGKILILIENKRD